MPSFTIERYGGRLIYFWFGMRFGALMKLFKRGNYSFTLNCIPDTLLLFLWVPWNSLLYWISEAKYKSRAEALKLDPRKANSALHLAWALQAIGQLDEAKNALQKAEALGWKVTNTDPMERAIINKLREDLNLAGN